MSLTPPSAVWGGVFWLIDFCSLLPCVCVCVCVCVRVRVRVRVRVHVVVCVRIKWRCVIVRLQIPRRIHGIGQAVDGCDARPVPPALRSWSHVTRAQASRTATAPSPSSFQKRRISCSTVRAPHPTCAAASCCRPPAPAAHVTHTQACSATAARCAASSAGTTARCPASAERVALRCLIMVVCRRMRCWSSLRRMRRGDGARRGAAAAACCGRACS